jgi:putative tricarboxylic transport membrane protein
MRQTYRITGLVLLPIALFLGYQSLTLTYYTPIGPGPGFFPVWLCGILACLAVTMIVQATYGEAEPALADTWPDRSGYWRIGIAIISLFASIALMSTLGFRATTFVFYIVLLVTFGRRNPLEILGLSFLGSFGVHFLFSRILSQPLPSGSMDW